MVSFYVDTLENHPQINIFELIFLDILITQLLIPTTEYMTYTGELRNPIVLILAYQQRSVWNLLKMVKINQLVVSYNQ